MAFKFLIRRPMRPRRTRFANRHGAHRLRFFEAFGVVDQTEPDLPSAGQFDIDLGKKLRVKQSAMTNPQAAVDSEPGAQRIEAVLGSRVTAPGKSERVDHPAGADRGMTAKTQLEVEKSEVEAGVVSDERRIADEFDQFRRSLDEQRLVGKKDVAEAVDRLGPWRHRPLRVEIGMEMPARVGSVDHLDAADLDDSIAARGIEPGRFRVEHDFAHDPV